MRTKNVPELWFGHTERKKGEKTDVDAFDMATHWEMSTFVCFRNGGQKNATKNDTITTYQQIDFSFTLVKLKSHGRFDTSRQSVPCFKIPMIFNQMIETSFLVHFFLALLMHQDNRLIYFLSIGHTSKSSKKKRANLSSNLLSRIDTYGVDLHTFQEYHRHFERCSISISWILNQFFEFCSSI